MGRASPQRGDIRHARLDRIHDPPSAAVERAPGEKNCGGPPRGSGVHCHCNDRGQPGYGALLRVEATALGERAIGPDDRLRARGRMRSRRGRVRRGRIRCGIGPDDAQPGRVWSARPLEREARWWRCRPFSRRDRCGNRRGDTRWGVGALGRCIHMGEGQHGQQEDHAAQERPECPQGRHDRGAARTGVVQGVAATAPRSGPVGEAEGRAYIASARTSPARMPPHSLEPHT